MRRLRACGSGLVLVILSCSVYGVSFGQEYRYADPLERVAEADLRSFDTYLDSHWETAQELYREPELLNDRSYVRDHRALRHWLEDHPAAAREIRANPRAFLWRDRQYGDRSMARFSEREQSSWDNYLADHPQIARDLSRDPELINDARFVHDRRSLDDWLHDHPAAARVIQANPREYIERGGAASSRYDDEPPTAEDIQSFERYLDRNWEVADELYRNPQLINEAGYVHARSSLNDWLYDHPRAARAIQAEPERFLWRQRALNLNDFLRQVLTPR